MLIEAIEYAQVVKIYNPGFGAVCMMVDCGFQVFCEISVTPDLCRHIKT